MDAHCKASQDTVPLNHRPPHLIIPARTSLVVFPKKTTKIESSLVDSIPSLPHKVRLVLAFIILKGPFPRGDGKGTHLAFSVAPELVLEARLSECVLHPLHCPS